MHFTFLRILSLSVCLFYFSSVNAQILDVNNLKVENYTIEDGLPSNECYNILQDSTGYIWIATDRGLVKYDGYNFEVIGVERGLSNLSCLNIKADLEGNIWIQTLGGKIFIVEPRTLLVKEYPNQPIIDSLLSAKTRILDIAIDRKMNFHAVLDGIGFLIIDPEGNWKLDRPKIIDDRATIGTIEVDNQILLCRNTRGPRPKFKELDIYQGNGFDKNPNWPFRISHKDQMIRVEDHDNESLIFPHAFKIDDTHYLYSVDGVNYIADDASYTSNFVNAQIMTLKMVKGKGIFTGEFFNGGLNLYQNIDDLKNNVYQKILEDLTVLEILVDNQNDIWISTSEAGIFRIKLSQNFTSMYYTDPKNRKINDLEVGFGYLNFLTDNSMMNVLDTTGNLRLNDVYQGLNLFKIDFDPFNQKLIINAQNPVKIDAKGNRSSIKRLLPKSNSIISSFVRSTHAIGDNEIIVLPPYGLLYYENLDSLQFHEVADLNNQKILSIQAIESNHYLLGTINGLIGLKDFESYELKNVPSVLGVRINAIENYKDAYLFATLGNGLILWDLENKPIQINKESGILSNNIESIFIDSKDRVYLITKVGLTSIKFDEAGGYIIKNLTKAQGLPSVEITDVLEWNNQIFVSAGSHIFTLKDHEGPSQTQEVLIEKIKTGDQILNLDDLKKSLHYTNNSISINYRTISFKGGPPIQYRYRINANPDWTYTESTSANFVSLKTGDYLFEVQSKNENGIWGESTTVPFNIDPPWWKTWWFLISLVGLICLIAYQFYKWRISLLQEKMKVERDIRELERSALQAQMNPHFIFNCLNSIQNFIMKNDRDAAMEYLTQFANLIRANLNASNEPKISLAEEERMLESYLSLEQLRMNQRFDYQIGMDQSINKETVHIPPMLIQPIVENSVIHGMKHVESGGIIKVDFSQNSDQLIVSIYDNGQPTVKTEPKTSKSLGMSITQKRLRYINNDKDVVIKPGFSENGTLVVMELNLD